MTSTVAALLRQRAEEVPDGPFMEISGEAATYGEMWERAAGLAAALHGFGVRRGDRVVLQVPNGLGFLDAWFATTLLGAVTVPLNVHLKGDFLRHQLDRARPVVAVVGDEEVDRFAAAADAAPSLSHVLLHGTDLERASSALPSALLASLAEVVAGHRGAPTPTHPSAPSDPTLVLFTSGTTGPSKGAVASNGYVLRSAAAMARMREATADDTFWSPLPMFHGNALFQIVLGAMLVGGRGALEPGFSLSRFWARVRETGATQLSVLGAMIQLLWEQPRQPDDADNPARCAIGAPIAADVHRAWEERFGLRFLTGFGLTEANPILISTMDQPPAPGSAGRRHEQFDVRLVDEHDREVPTGTVGEIVCRARQPHAMFDGYLDDPAATAAVLRDGWFHTGDCGREDEDGWFTFTDRIKDAIRRRGENVSSWEVECAVAAHPAVEVVAAYGVPSELSEDEVMVAVVRKPDVALEPEELVAHCATRMPYFAVPRFVRFVLDLPYNDLGKVQKDLLRAEGSRGAWDRERSEIVVER